MPDDRRPATPEESAATRAKARRLLAATALMAILTVALWLATGESIVLLALAPAALNTTRLVWLLWWTRDARSVR